MVGATGFEPATSWSQTKRAAKLRHAPFCNFDITISSVDLQVTAFKFPK